MIGSPPQVRGKLSDDTANENRTGITPAGAGKTSLHVYAHGFYWDHPRRCGENDAVLRMPFNTSGSPPQVRGKHTDVFA